MKSHKQQTRDMIEALANKQSREEIFLAAIHDEYNKLFVINFTQGNRWLPRQHFSHLALVIVDPRTRHHEQAHYPWHHLGLETLLRNPYLGSHQQRFSLRLMFAPFSHHSCKSHIAPFELSLVQNPPHLGTAIINNQIKYVLINISSFNLYN